MSHGGLVAGSRIRGHVRVVGTPFKVTKPREFELRAFDYREPLTTTGATLATTGPDLVCSAPFQVFMTSKGLAVGSGVSRRTPHAQRRNPSLRRGGSLCRACSRCRRCPTSATDENIALWAVVSSLVSVVSWLRLACENDNPRGPHTTRRAGAEPR
jgi:hypothetical protein